jgi:hypothetical protein
LPNLFKAYSGCSLETAIFVTAGEARLLGTPSGQFPEVIQVLSAEGFALKDRGFDKTQTLIFERAAESHVQKLKTRF